MSSQQGPFLQLPNTADFHKQIAQSHISALESLINAYAMIGEAIPGFDKLSSAFKDDPEFLQVMGHFYEDILEFHRRAYKFFRRRGKPLFLRFSSRTTENFSR